mmetsp:Transcript_446/g.789  ORF Transcript_446/g.789 Transcript_446/m.789 type:complete len:204 (+) Transcript_446:122-733(+)
MHLTGCGSLRAVPPAVQSGGRPPARSALEHRAQSACITNSCTDCTPVTSLRPHKTQETEPAHLLAGLVSDSLRLQFSRDEALGVDVHGHPREHVGCHVAQRPHDEHARRASTASSICALRCLVTQPLQHDHGDLSLGLPELHPPIFILNVRTSLGEPPPFAVKLLQPLDRVPSATKLLQLRDRVLASASQCNKWTLSGCCSRP